MRAAFSLHATISGCAAQLLGPRRRCFSSSVLGTETFSAKFVESLRTEMAEAERDRKGATRDMWVNCIRKGELDHMESPEADAKQIAKIDRLATDLFTRLPAPKDPMKAALQKTAEEMIHLEELESIKDMMRDRYRAKQQGKRVESKRIEAAMDQVARGKHRLQQEGAGIESFVDMEEESVAAAQRESQMKAEIEAMKRRIAMLETELQQKNS